MTYIKLYIILLLLGTMFISGCEGLKQCRLDNDCSKETICVGRETGITGIGYCIQLQDKINLTETQTEELNESDKLNVTGFIPTECLNGTHSWMFTNNCISDELYCYQNNSNSLHCTCDVLTYPDGHNETRNCECWNDLVMHYICINLTENNITLIKEVER